jgi:hypothetical protein
MRLRLRKPLRPTRRLAVPRRATDVETALLRYLMFGVLPGAIVKTCGSGPVLPSF